MNIPARPALKIAVDTRPLSSAFAAGGVGTLCRNLFAELKRQCSLHEDQLVWMGNSKKILQQVQGGRYVSMVPRPRKAAGLADSLLWPLDLLRVQPDILLCPAPLTNIWHITLPLVAPCSVIPYVMDLNVLEFGPYHQFSNSASFKRQIKALHRLPAIVTISQYVKKALVERLHLDGEKIHVFYPALDGALIKAKQIAEHPTDSLAPFILTIGWQEHKNISTTIKAYRILQKQGYAGELRIIGAKDKQHPDVFHSLQSVPHPERVLFESSLSVEELYRRYALCDAFCYPSFCEGFGFPVLEALYCGAYVIASANSSMPEAGGSAACYVQPEDYSALASEIQRVLDRPHIRVAQRQRAASHCSKFSWEASTRKLLALMEKVVSNV